MGAQYLPNDNLRQSADAAVTDFLAAQLLNVGNAWVSDQVERRPLAHRHDDSNIRTVDRGADCRPGRGAEVDAAAEHRLHYQTRSEEDYLRFYPFFAEEPLLARHPKRQIQGAGRHHRDARRCKLRCLSADKTADVATNPATINTDSSRNVGGCVRLIR